MDERFKLHIFVETYEDNTCCIRFDNRGFRIPLAQAEDLLKKLSEAVSDLRARESS
jgi:hypothetical protein